MIYVVEVPHEGRARAWFAFDPEDFIRKVHAARGSNGRTVFETLSGGEALARVQAAGGDAQTLRALVANQGNDSPVYRADYLLGDGVYQPEAVDEFEACVIAVASGLKTCRIYPDDERAAAALHHDPFYGGRDGLDAHLALREQLIAMEVIADDL